MVVTEAGSTAPEDASMPWQEEQVYPPSECPGVSFDYVAALIGRPTALQLLEILAEDLDRDVLA